MTPAVISDKPIPFGRVLVWAFGLFQLGPLVHEVLAWTDPLKGLEAGVIMSVFYLVPFVLFVLPWCLVGHLLYWWRGRLEGRNAWALMPAVGMLVFMLAALVREPPTERGRFERLAGIPLPASATNVRSYREGGLDPQSVYSFLCTPADTRALVGGMGLEEWPVEVVDFRPVGSGIDSQLGRGNGRSRAGVRSTAGFTRWSRMGVRLGCVFGLGAIEGELRQGERT